MKLLATLLVIWLVCLLVGASFGILGKVIWIAVLATLIGALWKYIKRDEST